MKQINLLEWKLQVQCVLWFRLRYPDKIIYSSNNGVRVSIGAAVKMRRMGMLRSMPDLAIPHAYRDYHSMYSEMKREGKKATKDQLEMITFLRNEGHYCVVCDTLDLFMYHVDWYFKEINS